MVSLVNSTLHLKTLLDYLFDLAFLFYAFQGTLVQVPSSHGGGGADWPPRHSQHQLRISSQDALLDSSGNGSSQLVIETGGAIGGQFMHHDWPLPSQGGRAQFASIVGGTLGRAGPRGGVPNVYPIQGAPVVANSRFVLTTEMSKYLQNSYFT